MKGIVTLMVVAVLAVSFSAGVAEAKFKKVMDADVTYNWQAVDKIVILPMTSNNVDFGKVDPARLPKIKAALETVKTTMRKQMVEGLNLSNPNKRFYYKAPDKKSTTLLVQYNIEKFDNGNMLKRNLLPFGGGAKVTLRATFMDGKTKRPVAEFLSTGKDSGGGLAKTDSDVLFTATKIADVKIFKTMKKLTGLTYDSYANLGKKAKMGLSDYGDVLKTEKKEKDVMKQKAKRGKK